MIGKEELYYASADGTDRIHAQIWIPEGEPKAVFQIIHGMQEYIDRYDEFARFMAERGLVVCGEDHLGHGKSVSEGGTYGYFCKNEPEEVIVKDSHKLTQIVRERFPGLPVTVMGHSFGSFMTRHYLTRYGNELSACILSGTGYQPGAVVMSGRILCGMQSFFLKPTSQGRMLTKIAFGSYLKNIPEPRTYADWLSYNEQSVDEYVKDPWCTFLFTINGFDTMFRLLSKVGNKDYMKKIPGTLPVLMSAGREDPVGGWGRDVKKLYHVYRDEIGLDVTLKLYDHMRHELHNEPGRRQVYEDYYNWISGQLKV